MVFEYIVVGNEAIPDPFSNMVGVAVTNLRLVLKKFAQRSIKVNTAVSIFVLGATFPPSIGVFKLEMKEPMADLLNRIRTFVLEPVVMVKFPYDYHAQGIIPQDFATFSMDKAYISDGQNGYSNVLDALLGAFYSAMAEENVTDVKLVVSASGWPSTGNGGYTTPTLAAKYNKNFMRRIASVQGTPARPGQPVDGFVYNLFNENQKAVGPAQHFGLFYSDTTPAYNFTVPH
ncbi:Glucan endo-1,3-beta-glucosidase, basic isoform [Morella rubra]|uniref:glucan endo-1,3-beta-D-glucosidase n=1 Tax=Morella rubra TaxID=262757 RepID=A0A6A1WBJ4_9ROSI|nr:Glucan endo-1,3-beta-glucosidase, basic isoform [Morella rubra]